VTDARTYEAAGVSLGTAEAVVERLRAAAESTGAEGFGAFAGLYPLDDRRLLVASTDSVGTKLIVARQRGSASRFLAQSASGSPAATSRLPSGSSR